MRAEIDYGVSEAKTSYGVIGIKVWIYKGEVFDLHAASAEQATDQQQPAPRRERNERAERRGGRDEERGHGHGREAIELFSQSGFSGARLGLHNEVRTLVDYDFNDQAGSIIVNEGRWELCEHADFGGRCIVLEPGRYEFLDNMNNRISSLRRIR